MKPRKIIWAVDPFAKSIQLQRSAALAIRSIQEGFRRPTTVQPVFFSTRHPRSIPRAAEPYYQKDLAKDASERLRKINKKIRIYHLRPLQVVPSIARSVKHLTDALLTYASREKSDLIVLSSRTKKGPNRWFMGSFAETLLLYSPIPVMVVSPSWKNRGSRFRRVLFPSDFSDASFLALLEILPLIERWGARLEIFHKVQYELPSIAQHASTPNLKHFHTVALERYLESLREKAEAWQLEAKHYGVNSSVHFDYSTSGNVADQILKVARRKADLIAMPATSGVGKTKLLGSVTRRVVRESTCPVWVLRQIREERSTRTIQAHEKLPKAA